MRVLFLALSLATASLTAVPSSAELISNFPTPGMSPDFAAARQVFIDGRYTEALRMLHPLAEAGDPMAQNMIGVAYDDGLGVGVDPILARRWFERAAARGNARAQMNLGQMLRDGRPGVPIDLAEARRLFQASADQDYGPAHSALGRMWERGEGGGTDLARAVGLYEQGRSAGDPWGSEYLGHVYYNGLGVAADPVRARALFAEASERGLAQSTNNLAYMLEQGMGGPSDMVQAERLYRQSIDGNYARAGINLAWMLYERADSRAAFAEASTHCTWAMENGDASDRAAWTDDCMTIGKAAAQP